ncbi:transcriptional regulator [Pseudomonas vanderleydeniana]|uniref:Transcriptional regulator n=1 Tax=Pseudomonas vanderleydeniana TaxID=2745495 RepID=A0A9E6PRY1_9PSED|nr:transcriptional regulator [Pseudomonas vanderleydeniana]
MLSTLCAMVARHPRATMAELAGLAGVSRASLHRFYGTREKLDEQLEQHALQVLERIMGVVDLATAPALAVLHRLWQEHLAHQELMAFLIPRYPLNTVATEQGQASWRFYRDGLDALFLRGQQQGTLRIDVTAPLLTELFITLLYGTMEARQRGRIADGCTGVMEEMFLHGAQRRPLGDGHPQPCTAKV